ncbi:hypothetical protein ACQKMZ_10570 [Bacillus paramycoides]|uniref:hypothetical protein n=1 Tax=Bacillus paramycoides TaxID=2026194 RepID=UPI003D02866F
MSETSGLELYVVKKKKEQCFIIIPIQEKSTHISMILDKKGGFLCMESLHTITYACPVKR